MHVSLTGIKRHFAIVGFNMNESPGAFYYLSHFPTQYELQIKISITALDKYRSWFGNMSYVCLRNKTYVSMSREHIGHHHQLSLIFKTVESSGKDLYQRRL